mmetsp:Transcript_7383/g.21816  ORF Transcript_7383/g.21816 Transcript_7383/m.21816 type:complete len:99 (-) Transcript_7383:1924-2220(-)
MIVFWVIAAIATAIVSSLLVCIRLHALNFPSAQDATPARQEALPLEKISIALAEGRWVSQPSGSLSVAIEVKDSADPTPAETSAGESERGNEGVVSSS